MRDCHFVSANEWVMTVWTRQTC